MESIYGDFDVVEACEKFGPYYKSIGTNYCGVVCPEGWIDSGILC